MKKILLLLLTAVITSYAAGASSAESALEIQQQVDNVKFNRRNFVSQSGFLERGILGYLCCCCPKATDFMRDRLKEKDLELDGLPLARSPYADEILDAFAEKHNLLICPFKSKTELKCNRVEQQVAGVQVFCTPVCCGIGATSCVMGLCAYYATGSGEAGLITTASLSTLSLPYISSGDDTFQLANCGLKKIQTLCIGSNAAGANEPKKDQ